MDKVKWNSAITKMKGDRVRSQEGPKKSGVYLCTCVTHPYQGERRKFLRTMYYDTKTKFWSDEGRPYTCSHC